MATQGARILIETYGTICYLFIGWCIAFYKSRNLHKEIEDKRKNGTPQEKELLSKMDDYSDNNIQWILAAAFILQILVWLPMEVYKLFKEDNVKSPPSSKSD